MQRSHHFRRRTLNCYAYAIAAASLIVTLAPDIDSAAMALASPAKAQPQDETKQQGTDADQERIFSGLQPGEEIKPFKVIQVQAEQTSELEIVKDTGEQTTLICFVHKLGNDDRILFGLGLVDFYASRHEGLKSHIVLLSDDQEKVTKMLRGWARGPLFTKSLVSLSVDGVEGPGYYGLNRNVAGMTVLVAKGDKVVDNLVFQAPNNRDLQTIMAAVAKALGEPEPTLAEVQQERRAERQRRAKARIKQNEPSNDMG